MAAKIIPVIGGYSLRFDQRARGEETPYWQGTIFKDGKQIGDFSNSGHGGQTNIHPHSIAEDFNKIALDEMKRQGYDKGVAEAENLVLEFGEAMGYQRQLKGLTPETVWPQFMKEVIEQDKDIQAQFAAFDKKG